MNTFWKVAILVIAQWNICAPETSGGKCVVCICGSCWDQQLEEGWGTVSVKVHFRYLTTLWAKCCLQWDLFCLYHAFQQIQKFFSTSGLYTLKVDLEEQMKLQQSMASNVLDRLDYLLVNRRVYIRYFFGEAHKHCLWWKNNGICFSQIRSSSLIRIQRMWLDKFIFSSSKVNLERKGVSLGKCWRKNLFLVWATKRPKQQPFVWISRKSVKFTVWSSLTWSEVGM